MRLRGRGAGIAALTLLTLIVAFAGLSARGESITITILHTNDIHGRLSGDEQGRGGMAALAAQVRHIRHASPLTLLVDAGDMTQGSPVSTMFAGRPLFDVMNACGYDAATLGNHEFDNGTDLIADFRAIARFPILSANVFRGETLVADAASTVIVRGSVRIGLLGLTTSQSVTQSDLRFADPIGAARNAVDQLGPETDLIVALSHLGLETDRRLAASMEGIDVIVGGHSHIALETPVRVGETWIVHAGSYGRYLGRLDMEMTPDGDGGWMVADAQGGLLPVPEPGLAPDQAVAQVVAHWESEVAEAVDVPIGVNPAYLDVPSVHRLIEHIWRETYGTDFALQNLGATRAPLPEGEILIRHIFNAMPFENHMVVLELTRAQVAEEIAGAVFIEDKPFYTVATNSYVADYLIRKYTPPEERVRRHGESWRDAVIAYIRRHGAPRTPGVETAPQAAPAPVSEVL